MIDKNMDEAEIWNFFKEVFENVDQEFFKKIQEKYFKLIYNDLKLCVYLCFNLFFKEIVFFFNIFVCSVEVKCYCLCKKMELEYDEGLVEYIFSI